MCVVTNEDDMIVSQVVLESVSVIPHQETTTHIKAFVAMDMLNLDVIMILLTNIQSLILREKCSRFSLLNLLIELSRQRIDVDVGFRI